MTGRPVSLRSRRALNRTSRHGTLNLPGRAAQHVVQVASQLGLVCVRKNDGSPVQIGMACLRRGFSATASAPTNERGPRLRSTHTGLPGYDQPLNLSRVPDSDTPVGVPKRSANRASAISASVPSLRRRRVGRRRVRDKAAERWPRACSSSSWMSARSTPAWLTDPPPTHRGSPADDETRIPCSAHTH